MEFSFGRKVEHDPRSRNFAYPVKAVPPKSVLWAHNGPVLDQGILGACTGFALANLMNTERYWRNRQKGNRWRHFSRSKKFLGNADGVDFYHYATQFDEFPGEFPPVDEGSSGLGVAKAGQMLNYLDNYTHTFSFGQFLAALSNGPVLAGTNWYDGMCYPNSVGRVSVSGVLRGGHEYVILGHNNKKEDVTILNSWSRQWGVNGRAKISCEDFQRLMYEEGDITVPGVILA